MAWTSLPVRDESIDVLDTSRDSCVSLPPITTQSLSFLRNHLLVPLSLESLFCSSSFQTCHPYSFSCHVTNNPTSHSLLTDNPLPSPSRSLSHSGSSLLSHYTIPDRLPPERTSRVLLSLHPSPTSPSLLTLAPDHSQVPLS